MKITGTLQGWRGVPVLKMAVHAPGLDLDLLIPKGKQTPLRRPMEALSRHTKFSATVSAHHAIYRGIRFDEVQAKVSGEEGVFILDPVVGWTGQGTISGQVRIVLPRGQPASVESRIHLTEVAVEPLIQAVGIQEPPLTGVLNLDGTLQGSGSDPRGPSHTLNGDIHLVIQKGYAHKLSATAKIVSLLNLPTLLAGKMDFSDRGMPFDCISGRARIKNGIAEIKSYIMDSPLMKITAAGTYDIPTDRYDLVMAASPFGSYEEFLKAIPLFGKLFAGEREGIVTSFFEVKGPMSNPEVSAMPVKSVTSGVTGLAQLAFDMLKNAILLPTNLLSPTKQPRSPCSAL
jgi:hypothetical protein